MRSLARTLLILGRVSNLPTIWSNCLAGWLLGGAENAEKLPLIFIGTTLLYVGGMYLNDAFDVQFDQLHRKERPIPSGEISLQMVWSLGLTWIALGEGALIFSGFRTGSLGLALVVCILVYDATHKSIGFGPVLMGVCRCLVYLIAASIAADQMDGHAVWCGLVLGLYVVGLSFLARGESVSRSANYWPALLLAAPIILALLMNADGYREGALLLSAVLALWIVRSLRRSFWVMQKNVGQTVAWLLAGIVFVDWLAAADAPRQLSAVFILLFLLAILFQRVVPAT